MIVLKIILELTVVRREKRGQAPQKELAEAARISPLLSLQGVIYAVHSLQCPLQIPKKPQKLRGLAAHHSQMFSGIF